MDQDAIWHGGRPWPKRHNCARWRLSSPPQKRVQFGPSLLWPSWWMDQDATWYGGLEVGLGPGHIVLMSVVAKQLDGSRCHLVRMYASAQATLCYMGTHLTLAKGTQPPIFGRCLLWWNGRPSQLLLSTCIAYTAAVCLMLVKMLCLLNRCWHKGFDKENKRKWHTNRQGMSMYPGAKTVVRTVMVIVAVLR